MLHFRHGIPKRLFRTMVLSFHLMPMLNSPESTVLTTSAIALTIPCSMGKPRGLSRWWNLCWSLEILLLPSWHTELLRFDVQLNCANWGQQYPCYVNQSQISTLHEERSWTAEGQFWQLTLCQRVAGRSSVDSWLRDYRAGVKRSSSTFTRSDETFRRNWKQLVQLSNEEPVVESLDNDSLDTWDESVPTYQTRSRTGRIRKPPQRLDLSWTWQPTNPERGMWCQLFSC